MPTEAPVAVVMGSDSDWAAMSETVKLLAEFGIGCTAEVISAHRTPERAREWSSGAEGRGVKVIIAAAAGAAHLAGFVAAHTTLPVIGVPLVGWGVGSGPDVWRARISEVPLVGWGLDGLDALLSTVQMPGGVPVATVSVGKAGAKNAAVLAAQILALTDESVRRKLLEFRAKMRDEVAERSRKVSEEARKIAGGGAGG